VRYGTLLLLLAQSHIVVDALPKKDFWDYFSLVLTAALVIIGALTFVAILYQAIKTADAAAATQDAAKATQEATEGIRRQIDIMERQNEHFTNSERAWALVDIGKLPDFQPDPNRLQILWIYPMIKNYGRTPAHITRIAGIVKLIPDGEKLPEIPEYTVGQGFDERINTVLPPEVPIQPRLGVSGDEFIRVQEGKVTLYVHGFVEYSDVNRNRRRSAYCFVYVRQGGFSPAESGFYPAFNAPEAYTECT